MSNLIIVPIEPIETRYTKHWYEYLPSQILQNTTFENVAQIELEKEVPANSAGGFFNFNFTCEYKAEQFEMLSKLVSERAVKNDDVFFFTDYWNPMVHMLKYVLFLNNIDARIVGFAHAGYWDPADILHKKFRGEWAKSIEISLHDAYDEIYFSTEFARDLYVKNLRLDADAARKCHVTGFPMEYYDNISTPYWEMESPPQKENIVVFPHRLSGEKNYELFKQIAKVLPEYEFVASLEVCKTKQEYHDLMLRSKVAVSFATQETGGISMGIEALRAGCSVVVPNRLSYAEIFQGWRHMYPGDVASREMKYTDWTDVYEVSFLAREIKLAMDYWDLRLIKQQHDYNYQEFFNGRRLYRRLEVMHTKIRDDRVRMRLYV